MNKKNKMYNPLNKAILVSFVGFILSGTNAWADVSGTVYRDLPVNGTTLNTYGIKDANESGVEGVTVTVTDSSGAVVGAPVTTDANGDWAVAGTSGDIRVEFTTIPAYLESSPVNSGSNTTVQFIADGDTANLGLHNPADYAGSTADIGMTFQVNNSGADQSLFTVRVLRNADVPGVTVAGLPTDGVSDNNGLQTEHPIKGDKVGFIHETGSVWGLAFNRNTQDIYVSAAVRRFTAMGPSGTGAIYKIDNANNVSLFTTVANTGSLMDNTSRGLSDDPALPSNDPVFDEVGRIALGDLDMSADGTELYTINVNTNEFVTIDIANPGTQNTYAIGNPFGVGCPATDVTSWGIGQHDGDIYVGSVCTTDVAAGAYVSQFDGTGFTPFHQIPLDMDGETSANYVHVGTMGLTPKRWRTWITDYNDLFHNFRVSYPAPILSDIEFDEDNGMIIGLIDRTAMQAGWLNYSPDPADTFAYYHDSSGDIVRVCHVGGAYFNEGHANCPQNPVGPANPPHPQVPEYFDGDEWVPYHSEISMGGLAYQQGSGSILFSAFDSVDRGYDGVDDNFTASGIKWLNTTSGASMSGIRMAGGGDDSIAMDYMGKAGGVGDVEYLNPPAPLEIGNRVWEDTNGNGIQDAGEAGIDGVVVTLNCGGADFTQTTTNGGQYLFTDANVTGGIPRDTDCTISVPTSVNGQALTTQTSATDETLGSNPDVGTGSFTFRTGLAGQNNHTYDIGYRDAPVGGSITIIKDATPNDPQDFAFTATGSGVANFSLDDDSDGTLSNIQSFTGLSDGAYSFTEATVANWMLTGISCTGATNSTVTTNATGVDITLSNGESIICTFYNNNHTCPSGQILNQVVVTANEDESTYANNSDEACLEVATSSDVDLALTKVASPTSVNSGDTVTYAITITNSGPGDATGVEVTDQLPTGVTYSTHNASQGTFTSGTGIWTVGDLANGASATLTIDVTAD
jgi:uncharacterized repeat protein (TIGR01451 family)